VLDAGPLGRQGPVIGAPAPVHPELTVPILTYHHVMPELPDDGNTGETVTSDALAGQLEWLADKGHNTIAVAELFNAFYYDLPLPPRPIILVFDDGYSDFYHNAYPVLRERGYRASVAAISDFMGEDGYLTWDQARELAQNGTEFVSHAASHANLAILSADDARREISESRRVLEEELGRPVQYFVYPYGEPFVQGDDAHRSTVVTLLQEAGYRGALTTSSGPPYIGIQRADAPFLLRRIPVSGGELLERFAISIEPTPTPEPAPTPSPEPTPTPNP
jgi:peptidoglycan/xylan/chitin deacetylase (PgdA/CDA1 family)